MKHNPHSNNLRNQTPLSISFRNIGKKNITQNPKHVSLHVRLTKEINVTKRQAEFSYRRKLLFRH